MVLGKRPVIAADTATGLDPEPGSEEHGALEPYEVDVPYSNSHFVTSEPLGLTMAFSVAVVCLIGVAGLVLAVGAVATAVVNSASAPGVVPTPLVAEMRKW